MVYIRLSLIVDMEPAHFYSFVLPLGVLIAILVMMVLYIARKEETLEKGWKKLMRAHMRNRLKQEKIFAEELEKLQTLVHDKTIDQDTYARLRKLLEMAFTRRLERLNARALERLQGETRKYARAD